MIKKGDKIALVLGGGGAKGYAHIGAIEAINESGAEIRSIAGTSMGALVGGLYAAGKLRQANLWFQKLDKSMVIKLMDFRNIAFDGLIDGEDIFRELYHFIGDVKIEDLPIKYSAVATNLDDGSEKVFTTGRLIDAIRASVSLPGIFRPYQINGCRYVDGGLVNGLPINRVYKDPNNIVVAIDLETFGVKFAEGLYDPFDFFSLSGTIFPGTNKKRTESTDNIFDILKNSFFISLKHNKTAMIEMTKPDIYVNIDLKGFETQDFDEASKIYSLGYHQVRKIILGGTAIDFSKFNMNLFG